jgi:hypothetical protein
VYSAAWGKQQLFKLTKLSTTADKAFVLRKRNIPENKRAG